MVDEKTNMHEEVDDLDLPKESQPQLSQVAEKPAEKESDDNQSLTPTKLAIIGKLLENISDSVEKINRLLAQSGKVDHGYAAAKAVYVKSEDADEAGKVVEGVFDGEGMIGPDGKQYSVPANYASKSKLVEGDILKLTITTNGTFVYKQISPIERRRVVGELEKAGSGFVVASEGKKWKLITASVTYYKGQAGDEVVVLVPKAGESKWAAVDNIVKAA